MNALKSDRFWLAGGILAASPWRGAYPEITRPDPGTYSAATIERGRLAAAAGACNVCHTDKDTAWAKTAMKSWTDRSPWRVVQ